jgi:hypothetical protein
MLYIDGKMVECKVRSTMVHIVLKIVLELKTHEFNSVYELLLFYKLKQIKNSRGHSGLSNMP